MQRITKTQFAESLKYGLSDAVALSGIIAAVS